MSVFGHYRQRLHRILPCGTQKHSHAEEKMLLKPPLPSKCAKMWICSEPFFQDLEDTTTNEKEATSLTALSLQHWGWMDRGSPGCPLTRRQRPTSAKPLPHRFYHLLSTRDVVWPFISLWELSQHNKVRLRLGAMWHSHTRVGPSLPINPDTFRKLPTFLPNIIKSCCDLSYRESKTVRQNVFE